MRVRPHVFRWDGREAFKDVFQKYRNSKRMLSECNFPYRSKKATYSGMPWKVVLILAW